MSQNLSPVSIVALASYLPPTVRSNQDIVNMRPEGIEPEDWTNEDWILRRTGIRERRVAPADWGSSDLMVAAAQRVLSENQINIADIDLIVTSTSFPDYGFNVPRTSEVFKGKIGAPQTTLSVEENAECAGFEWALIRAQEMMTLYGYQKVLVVSGDKTTAATNPKDRRTLPLFGDAGGAVILSPCEEGNGILASIRGTDPQYIDAITVPAGGSKMPANETTYEAGLHYMDMPGGAEMLKVIGGKVFPDTCRQVCEMAGIEIEQVRHRIPHQANIRISNAAESKLKQPVYKGTQLWFGNTSGSSIAVALDTIYLQGDIGEGDYIIIGGFGAGFDWGTILMRWTMKRFRFAG